MRQRHRRDEQFLEPRFGRGLDLGDPTHRGFHLGAQRSRQQGLHRAGAGGIADRPHAVDRTVGHETEHHRVDRIDVGAECPGEADVGDLRRTGVLDEQVDAGAQRSLGELDRAYVVLGDGQLGVAGGVQHVRERPAVGDDALRPRRHLTADRAVGLDQTRQVHLGDDVDDARTAHPGHTRRRDGLVEAGIVRPHVRADHLERWFECLAVDPHTFDGARRRTLPAADLRTLERRTGRARRGVLAGAVAEHDLGVGADVDEQLHRVATVRALGEQGRRRVGADVTGDARPGVERRRRQVEVEVARQADHGLIGRQHERRRPERCRIDAERDVMHDRVPDEHDLEDVLAVDPGVVDELTDQLVERGRARRR